MQIKKNYPIRQLNTWRLGSTVKYYSEPKSREDLVSVLEYGEKTHHGNIFLGLGSNMFMPDHQFDAHIIKTTQMLNVLSQVEGMVYTEVGVSLAKVAKYCARLGYVDAAFLAGIPGTVGGALAMNAGANGHSIWDFVESVEVMTTNGICWLSKDQFEIGYRQVKMLFTGFIGFLSVKLSFSPGCAQEAKATIKRYLYQRNQVQPIGTFNCGCVFRNPVAMSAGRLVDQLGLLGYQVGDARISPIHGNFIENLNQQATSEQIWSIIQYIKKAVLQAHNIDLILEVTVYE